MIDTPLLERVTAIALLHRDSWRRACNDVASDVSDWPSGFCVDATYALVEELREKVPEAGATYVWGAWGSPTSREHRVGHAWCELADGTIVDLTVGQFNVPVVNDVEDLLVVPAGPEYARLRSWWHEEQRNRFGRSGRPVFVD